MLLTRLREVICEREEVLRKQCRGPTVFMVTDKDCKFLNVSKEREQILGYQDENVRLIDVYTHCHPDDRWSLMMMFSALVTKNVQGMCDFRGQHVNGRWVPMRVYAEPLIEDGEVLGYIGAYYERIDLRAWEERKRLQMLISQMMNKSKTNRP